jgi:hypothetical protein
MAKDKSEFGNVVVTHHRSSNVVVIVVNEFEEVSEGEIKEVSNSYSFSRSTAEDMLIALHRVFDNGNIFDNEEE